MGHRSLAEMYAKEVLSEVDEGAAEVRVGRLVGDLMPTGLGIVLHFGAAQLLKMWSRYTRCQRVSVGGRVLSRWRGWRGRFSISRDEMYPVPFKSKLLHTLNRICRENRVIFPQKSEVFQPRFFLPIIGVPGKRRELKDAPARMLTKLDSVKNPTYSTE